MTPKKTSSLTKFPMLPSGKYILKILSSLTVITNSFVEKSQNTLYISLKIRNKKEDNLASLDTQRLYKYHSRLKPVQRREGHACRGHRRMMIPEIDAKTEPLPTLAAGVDDKLFSKVNSWIDKGFTPVLRNKAHMHQKTGKHFSDTN